jgi:hypothetical protein
MDHGAFLIDMPSHREIREYVLQQVNGLEVLS